MEVEIRKLEAKKKQIEKTYTDSLKKGGQGLNDLVKEIKGWVDQVADNNQEWTGKVNGAMVHLQKRKSQKLAYSELWKTALTKLNSNIREALLKVQEEARRMISEFKILTDDIENKAGDGGTTASVKTADFVSWFKGAIGKAWNAVKKGIAKVTESFNEVDASLAEIDTIIEAEKRA